MPSRLHRYDVPGHVHFWTVSCFRRLTFFWHDAMKTVVIEALRSLQEQFGVCLVGYVVMPEHVHFIVYPHAGCHWRLVRQCFLQYRNPGRPTGIP